MKRWRGGEVEDWEKRAPFILRVPAWGHTVGLLEVVCVFAYVFLCVTVCSC